uniref:Uncharacterized protein n=1 Tax=Arundo donax TaxID=35708 RepID=A0A0A9EPK5_ARUDO
MLYHQEQKRTLLLPPTWRVRDQESMARSLELTSKFRMHGTLGLSN